MDGFVRRVPPVCREEVQSPAGPDLSSGAPAWPGGESVIIPRPETLHRRPLVRLLQALVRLYRWLISPLLGPPRCRYVPSCSAYALEALEGHGAWRGSVLTLQRLARCHPWGGSGFDPVPPPPSPGPATRPPGAGAHA